MVLRLLLTRPRNDSETLASLLTERGFEIVIEPLLDIVFHDDIVLDLNGVVGFLVTSANGVRALVRHDVRRDLPLFAVGESTGEEAQRSGFIDIAWAGGDVSALAALVRDTFDAEQGILLHAAGANLAGDLAGDLAASGFRVRSSVLYEACPRPRFSDDLLERFRGSAKNAINGVLFFSPRTGGTFASLIKYHGLTSEVRMMSALCLSAAVARRIEILPWWDIVVADRPERAALMEVLTKTALPSRV